MLQVYDDFAAPGLIAALQANWPSPESGHWHSYGEWNKLATKNVNTLPHAAHLLLGQMAMIEVPGAFPDLDHLHGSGLHQIGAGGQLGLHLDSERHPLLPWKREASTVLYLDDCDGGEFEMIEKQYSVDGQVGTIVGSHPTGGFKMAFCDGTTTGDSYVAWDRLQTVDVVTEIIETRSNRLVMFSTPGQWHRVAPVRSLRRSLCLFFWSLDRSENGASQATFR